MIERITKNVFGVRPHDAKHRTSEMFEQLRDAMMCDFSYIVVTKRNDARINGTQSIVEGIENDFRSRYLIVVKTA
jgi:hypothetical protein